MALGPTLPEETDILIVGGGIVGTATAFWLSRKTDREMTLVDKDNVAGGATGDSSAILRHVYEDRPTYAEMAWWSHEFYRDFEDETGYELSTPDQPLIQWGGPASGHEVSPMVDYETLQSLDIPVTRYEADELPALFPLFEFTDGFEYAVSDDEAGYTEPATAANGFAKAAQDNGARVVTGVAVESIDADDGTVAGVETDEGYIACEDVVIAAGSWSYKLAATVDVDLPITPEREQALLLDPPENVSKAELRSVRTTGRSSSNPDGVWWYFRADFGDTIYMGTHARADSVDPDDYDRTPDQKRKVEAFDILDEFAPKLADSEIVGEFCGVTANTPDQGFIIDQVGPDGLYALVDAGHGFKHGPVIGHLGADLVLDGESDLFDVDLFTVDRFDDRSPNQPLTYDDPAELHLATGRSTSSDHGG
ncbi:MAG: NAD(P)/FAD-dependent oxidoreductase [Haloarculaceae archaeon]